MPLERTRRPSAIVVIGFVAAVIALLMVGGAGPAYRLKLVELGQAFALLKWGAWTGLGVVLVCLVGAWITRSARRRGLRWALAGIAIGAIAFGVPFSMLQMGRRLPPIHDITTDTANPPRFVDILPLRKGSPNPVEYQDGGISQQQRTAYPDIQPATMTEPADAAFKRALDAARGMGWQIVAAVPEEKRIEATDTTLWFGFEDDIVVRITPMDRGSRVDVRSVSRVGQGDLGKNAARIRAYLQRLQQ
jgi:uncharacterized protein (DUF1499 family)